MIIRAAIESDISECLEMARNFYDVAGYKKDVPFCADSCAEWMKFSISQGLLFVADAGQKLAGFVIAVASPFIMNRKYLAGAELAWWMEPEYRHGSAGIKLLKAIEDSAKKSGIKFWSMMSLEEVDPDKVDKLYRSMGYQKTENTYMKVF